MRALVLRRGGSNSRPSGYEPDELPLLYFAMWGAKVRVDTLLSKRKIKKGRKFGPLLRILKSLLTFLVDIAASIGFQISNHPSAFVRNAACA